MVWKAIVIIIALLFAGLTIGPMFHPSARPSGPARPVLPALVTLHMGSVTWTCANNGANAYNCAPVSPRLRQ
jgi:hypothetical protein